MVHLKINILKTLLKVFNRFVQSDEKALVEKYKNKLIIINCIDRIFKATSVKNDRNTVCLVCKPIDSHHSGGTLPVLQFD